MNPQPEWHVRLNRRIPPRLKRHGKAVARRIKASLEELQRAPRKGKPLKGYPGVRSLPVTTPSGEFRIIYRLVEADKVILVDLIEPREEVYKLLKRRRSAL